MKILVATGSFKDVYSPLEAADVLCSALDREKNEVSMVPFCDGGEYTFEVLKHCFDFRERTVEQVVNPYGKPVSSRYLFRGGAWSDEPPDLESAGCVALDDLVNPF